MMQHQPISGFGMQNQLPMNGFGMQNQPVGGFGMQNKQLAGFGSNRGTAAKNTAFPPIQNNRNAVGMNSTAMALTFLKTRKI